MPSKFSLSAADLALALASLTASGISALSVADDYSGSGSELAASPIETLAYKAVAETLLATVSAYDYDSLAAETEFYANSLPVDPLSRASATVSAALRVLANPESVSANSGEVVTALATVALALSGTSAESVAAEYTAKGGKVAYSPHEALAYKAVASAAYAILGLDGSGKATLKAVAENASLAVTASAATPYFWG